jgi:hypothetical protein
MNTLTCKSLNILLAQNIAMFKEFIYNELRFVNGIFSVGKEKQFLHAIPQ